MPIWAIKVTIIVDVAVIVGVQALTNKIQTEMKNMRNQMIPLTVANTLDQSVKERIEAQSQQTVKQAVESAKMAPQGQFDVFDALGKVVSQQKVDNFRDQTIYVGVQKVAGGAGGVPLTRLDELRVDFPSIKTVNQHTDSTHTDMVVLQFPSAGRTSSGFWRLVIHCPDAASGTPHSFILNKNEMCGRTGAPIISGNAILGVHQNDGVGTKHTTIPGTNKIAHWICQGPILPVLNHLGKDPITRMGAYINHIQNLLNS
jgi:hypothetical protein